MAQILVDVDLGLNPNTSFLLTVGFFGRSGVAGAKPSGRLQGGE